MVRPVDDFEDDGFDEDDDDRRPLSVAEIDLEYERLTSSWSPLEKFAAQIGIVESLTVVRKDLHSTALGKYDVTREVARGGMGVVFEAVDRELGRTVALKLWYEPTGAPDEKIRREAMNLARLSHPNVVVVHEVDRVEDLFYMAMEFVRGRDLRERLARPMPWRDATRLFVEAGQGLAAAHEAGLVHGDFKPENILVGDDGRVRVADFGVARAMETDASDHDREPRPADRPASESPIGGTPAYMAPERLSGQRGDARSDQFSFCVALWEAIFGERPFSGRTELALWAAITEGEPVVGAAVAGISARLVAALRRGLSPQAVSRFPSMPVLLAELAECLAEPERERQRQRVKTTVVVSTIAGLLLGTTITALIAAYALPQVQPVSKMSQREVLESAPPFATVNEVTAAFSEWQATEPDSPSLGFAERGTELAGAMRRSAEVFAKAGDRSGAASTLMLSKVVLHYSTRHYGALGLVAAEHDARRQEIAALRAIDGLTDSDHSQEIASLEVEQSILEQGDR